MIIKINSREFLPEKEYHEIFLINIHSSKILGLLYNHLQNLEIEIVEEFFSLKKEFISVIWNKKKIKSNYFRIFVINNHNCKFLINWNSMKYLYIRELFEKFERK